MNRVVVLVCGVVAYVAFLGAFLYLMAFLAGIVGSPEAGSDDAGAIGQAMLINSVLVLLFGLQHAVMARDRFKERWTRIVPEPLERSVFVMAASLVLALLCWQWRPLPAVVWDVDAPWLRTVVWCLFVSGIGIILYTSFLIDHFDLFGLRQVWLHFRGRPYTHIPFTVRSLYKVVRHPMMDGMLLTFWCTPTMTAGHLQFAILMTTYTLVGVYMEERSLLKRLGEDYRQYCQHTPMLIPVLLPRRFRKTRVGKSLATNARPS